MKSGDMVRFRLSSNYLEPHKPKRLLGLLVEYSALEKIATIMYEGEIIRLRAADVEKAGKKDFKIQ